MKYLWEELLYGKWGMLLIFAASFYFIMILLETELL